MNGIAILSSISAANNSLKVKYHMHHDFDPAANFQTAFRISQRIGTFLRKQEKLPEEGATYGSPSEYDQAKIKCLDHAVDAARMLHTTVQESPSAQEVDKFNLKSSSSRFCRGMAKALSIADPNAKEAIDSAMGRLEFIETRSHYGLEKLEEATDENDAQQCRQNLSEIKAEWDRAKEGQIVMNIEVAARSTANIPQGTSVELRLKNKVFSCDYLVATDENLEPTQARSNRTEETAELIRTLETARASFVNLAATHKQAMQASQSSINANA